MLAEQVKLNGELQAKADSEVDTAGALMKAHETALAHKEKAVLEFVKQQEEAIKALRNQMHDAEEDKATIPTSDIMATLDSKLREKAEALKKEKELKFLDDMILLKQQKINADRNKRKSLKSKKTL